MTKKFATKKSTFTKKRFFVISTELVVLVGLSWMVVLNISKGLSDYTKGVTSFASKTEVLTFLDNPTVTVCFFSNIEHQLGYNLALEGTRGSTLNIFNFGHGGMFKINDSLGKAYLMSIDTLTVRRNKYSSPNEQCIKISTVSSYLSDGTNAYVRKIGEPVIDDETCDPPASFYFGLTFDDVSFFNAKAVVYFTSEANAYGVVGDFTDWQGVATQWYEGRVRPKKLELGHGKTFSVAEVTVVDYIDKDCSKRTYHQCLAKQLRDSKTCADFGGEPCSPYSLPNDSNTDLHFPLCNKKEEEKMKCYQEEYLNKSDHSTCREQKSCRIKEFQVEERLTFKGKNREEMGCQTFNCC